MQISGISSAESNRSASATTPASQTLKRYSLAGRRKAIDPRVDAARGDLADIRVADRIFAPHYASAVIRTVVAAAPVLAPDGSVLSEVLAGETFEVLELSAGRAWGLSAVDGSVGHVEIDNLTVVEPATHIVCAPSAPVEGAAPLPMGSRIAGVEVDGWVECPAGRIAISHLRPLGAPVADFVAIAESLLGTPATPGGRSGAGLDGAGLVFLILSLGGIRAPRFVDLQAAKLGHVVADSAPILRGDLIFVENDVAIARDGQTAIHVAAGGVATIAIADLGSGATRRRLP